jgi:Glycosyl transferases group 1
VEALALGVCVVRPPSRARLHVPLVEDEHVVACAADLADVCSRLARDDVRRERIARNGRDFFDRYLSPRELAAYYLHEIFRVAETVDG